MIIVKVGGGEGINYDAVCDDIAQLWREGQSLCSCMAGRIVPIKWPKR